MARLACATFLVCTGPHDQLPCIDFLLDMAKRLELAAAALEEGVRCWLAKRPLLSMECGNSAGAQAGGPAHHNPFKYLRRPCILLAHAFWDNHT